MLTNYPPKRFPAARDLVSLSTVRVRSMLSIWFLAWLLLEDVVATKQGVVEKFTKDFE